MCGRGRSRKLPAMDESTVSIRLELRLDDDVPSGVAFGNGSSQRPFAGWLGLMGAIEALTADPQEDEHADD
jgi:hypothetical protein